MPIIAKNPGVTWATWMCSAERPALIKFAPIVAVIASRRSKEVFCRFQAAYSGAGTIGRLKTGKNSLTQNNRPGSEKESGRRKTAFTTLKIRELAPIARASVTSAAAVNPGVRRKRRRA